MARGLRLRPMLTEPRKQNVYRRDVLCGSGAFVFGVLVASLLRGSKPVYAQPIASDVPEVDRVSVRVVTDSYQFAVAVGKKTGSVHRRRNEEVGRRHEQSGA